jgi:hypothetical protein
VRLEQREGRRDRSWDRGRGLVVRWIRRAPDVPFAVIPVPWKTNDPLPAYFSAVSHGALRTRLFLLRKGSRGRKRASAGCRLSCNATSRSPNITSSGVVLARVRPWPNIHRDPPRRSPCQSNAFRPTRSCKRLVAGLLFNDDSFIHARRLVGICGHVMLCRHPCVHTWEVCCVLAVPDMQSNEGIRAASYRAVGRCVEDAGRPVVLQVACKHFRRPILEE